MRQLLLIAALLAALPAMAGNNNGPDYGDTYNQQTYNQPQGGAATASGGNATANGGTSIAGAAAGANASVGDVTNIASGGQGGRGGDGGNALAFGGAGGKGGDANQGQLQGQHQANVGINGQQQSAASDQSQSSTNTLGQSTDASSQNDNRSSAAGNTTSTNVSYRSERNAPPVYLGNVAATVSCAGGFSAGSSSQGGAGALGFNWISPDCKTVVAGQNLQSLGMVDVACRVFKTTDGFKRAAKRDPSLNDVDCSIAK